MKIYFDIAKIPRIIFGVGKIKYVTDIILEYGTKVLLLTGSSSLKNADKFESIIDSFAKNAIYFSIREISSEPTPGDINSITKDFSDKQVDVVVAIGGGSVLDAGKAVSAMLGKHEPVEEYLEDIGTKTHNGTKKPYIAIPTTAGTGSETTKNAVLSYVGEHGYKKSMRHNNFVPDIALVDPELTMTCPSSVTAACGMDAFTQLLESYISKNASPITDALAYSGLEMISKNLVPAATTGSEDLEIRSAMSYASLLSGITLTNAGLGIVHGLASPIGSYYKIPHGVVCGTLVGVATRINIENLRKNESANLEFLKKYAKIGKLFSTNMSDDLHECCDYLLEKIDQWTSLLKIPKLSAYGFQSQSIEKVVNETGNKFNPVKLTRNDIEKIISDRM